MEAPDCTAFSFIQIPLVEDKSLAFSGTNNHLISFMEQLNKWAQSGDRIGVWNEDDLESDRTFVRWPYLAN